MQYIRNLIKNERPAIMELTLKLDEVIIDNDLNPRDGALDQDVVLDYSAHVDDLPLMAAYDVQGLYYLVGGFHRYAAHRLAMRTEGRFVVHRGSREEAKEFADLDNLKHGLRLSRAERRKVIERQLKRHPDWSDVRLATACASTDKTVRVVREELEANSEIPRLDALVGSDGITRPRTISQPARSVEPEAGQATLESAVPVAGHVFTSATQEVWDDENTTGPQPGEAEMFTPMAHQVGQASDDETEASQADEDQPQPELESPSARDTRPLESVVPPPAAPAAPLPPPPPPTISEAPWALSISIRPGSAAPPLLTILHGSDPQGTMPAGVAERVIEAIRARVEADPPAPVVVEVEEEPAMPEWLKE